MRSMVKRLALRTPLIGPLLADRDEVLRACGPHRPGHFYSPIADRHEIERDRDRLWAKPRTIPGVDLREAAQLTWLKEFARYYKEQPFAPHRTTERRYWLENGVFNYTDGISLYCMLRHVRPRNVIEVGSGLSSAAMLDTSSVFLGDGVRFTFIDPYPQRLHEVLRPGDAQRTTILERRVQDVPVELFCTLQADDILFIDSSHVAKIGSDVNYLLGEVLPALPVGVYVHFHDVPYPFEYFREWIDRGVNWNEAYMVRAFLAFNRAFEIVFYPSFMVHFHRDWFDQNMPLCLHDIGGSLWLRRTG